MAQEHGLLSHLLDRGRRHQPLVGGHRGASAHAPENTLAAFRAALEDGADLVELDVHLTRDGALAVIHDANTRRTTGSDGTVAGLTMAQLRRLDAGRQRRGQWADEGERGTDEGVPELGDVFALVRGRLLVNVEVKSDPATIPALATRLAEYGMGESVIVSSFDPDVVQAVSALDPAPLTGLLLDRPVPDPVAAVRAVGAALLHLKHTYVTATLVQDLHAAGLGALAWTVNRPAQMRRLRALGVDAILSDDPRLLREVLQ